MGNSQTCAGNKSTGNDISRRDIQLTAIPKIRPPLLRAHLPQMRRGYEKR
ncbi:hypothetical protein GCM10010525_14490 [Glutamicibacter bergerei]